VSKLLPEHKKSDTDHHEAVDYKEMPAVMAGLRSTSGVAVRAIEFIGLTAVRSGEARWMTSDEIDLSAALWIIPAERMKNRREHRVPLCDRAVTILKDRLQEATGSLIFEGQTEGGPISEQSLLRALRAVTGGKETTHGLRSTFRDWAGDTTNYPHDIMEFALAHGISDKTVAAYRRGDALEKRRALMQEWADYCASAVNG
jgi:integrase